MKILVVYSSRTGNTKMVAEAIAARLGKTADLKAVHEAFELSEYECVIAGFWIDKNDVDEQMKSFLPQLHKKKVALFTTMGADPSQRYGEIRVKHAAAYLPDDAVCLDDYFACIGKIAPDLIERFKQLPPEHPHAMTEEKVRLYKERAEHPDKKDLEAAAAFAEKILSLV